MIGQEMRFRTRSRTQRVVRMLMFLPLVIIFAALFGWIVMLLWNWLMPVLFGLKTITYWQAWGLVVLGRILFGGWRGAAGGHGYRGRGMARRWARMTPEEREKFRQAMRERWCGPQAAPPSSTSGG
jgi:hypothetical protein